MTKSTEFNRGLSESFLRQLCTEGSAARRLLRAMVEFGLDVRLRGDYFNAYDGGNSLAKVSWGPKKGIHLELHHKYVPVQMRDRLTTIGEDGDYLTYRFSATVADAYLESMPAIRDLARAEHPGPEGVWEHRLVAANASGTPVVAIDRQIQDPGDPTQRKLDVLALADGDSPTLVVVEIKRNADNRIQDVAAQALNYLKIFDADGSGLREDIARSFQRVCQQMQELGLPTANPTSIGAGMPVRALVVLADYNHGSELLDRARAEALERPISFCHVTDDALAIPAPDRWLS